MNREIITGVVGREGDGEFPLYVPIIIAGWNNRPGATEFTRFEDSWYYTNNGTKVIRTSVNPLMFRQYKIKEKSENIGIGFEINTVEDGWEILWKEPIEPPHYNIIAECKLIVSSMDKLNEKILELQWRKRTW